MHERSRYGALLAIVAIFLPGLALAAPVPVTNPSFESGPRVDGGFLPGCVIPGWDIPVCVPNDAGYWNPSVGQTSPAFVAGIPDGDHIHYSNKAAVFQTTGEVIQGGVSYILTVGVGGRPGFPATHEAQLMADDGAGGFTTLASATGHDVTDQWCDQVVCVAVPFNSPAVGQNLRIALLNPGAVVQVNFDDVRLEKVNGIACGQVASTCPQGARTGACCTDGPLTDSECIITDQRACTNAGGSFLGDNSQCIGPAECTALVVTYELFTADVTDDGVLIQWTTSTEVDTVGFRLLRAVGEAREKQSPRAISPIIPAHGDNLQGGSYQYIDADRHASPVVLYYIEDIDTFGRVRRHGPITVNRGIDQPSGRIRADQR